jgi:hypothetical protein
MITHLTHIVNWCLLPSKIRSEQLPFALKLSAELLSTVFAQRRVRASRNVPEVPVGGCGLFVARRATTAGVGVGRELWNRVWWKTRARKQQLVVVHGLWREVKSLLGSRDGDVNQVDELACEHKINST